MGKRGGMGLDREVGRTCKVNLAVLPLSGIKGKGTKLSAMEEPRQSVTQTF